MVCSGSVISGLSVCCHEKIIESVFVVGFVFERVERGGDSGVGEGGGVLCGVSGL